MQLTIPRTIRILVTASSSWLEYSRILIKAAFIGCQPFCGMHCHNIGTSRHALVIPHSCYCTTLWRNWFCAVSAGQSWVNGEVFLSLTKSKRETERERKRRKIQAISWFNIVKISVLVSLICRFCEFQSKS